MKHTNQFNEASLCIYRAKNYRMDNSLIYMDILVWDVFDMIESVWNVGLNSLGNWTVNKKKAHVACGM